MGKFKKIFSPPKQKPPPLPPPPKRDSAADLKKGQEAEAKARKGRMSSMLTGAAGVTDELGAVSRPEARKATKLGE